MLRSRSSAFHITKLAIKTTGEAETLSNRFRLFNERTKPIFAALVAIETHYRIMLKPSLEDAAS